MNYPYIHLKTQSSYSLAESTLKIKKLINLAKINKMPAIALTDNNNMFGALEFAIECVDNGIQPIIGSTINYLDIEDKDNFAQLNFLVKNAEGYKNLLYLSSLSHTGDYKNVGITFKDLEKHHSGLICFIGGEFNPLLILKLQNKISKIDDFIKNFKNIFNEDLLFEIQRINIDKVDEFEDELILQANKYQIPVICPSGFD